MRQSGIIAAAGIVALDKMIDRLQVDHDHIYQIAKGKLIFTFYEFVSGPNINMNGFDSFDIVCLRNVKPNDDYQLVYCLKTNILRLFYFALMMRKQNL